MVWNGTVTYDPASYYNTADIIRQNQNIQHLQGMLSTNGYNATFYRPISTGLTRKDFATVARIEDMRGNIRSMLTNSYIPAGVPSLVSAPINALTSVTWTNFVKAGVSSGNTLQKSGAVLDWNAGATSVQYLTGNGSYFQFTSETAAYKMVGLASYPNASVTTAGAYWMLNYAFFLAYGDLYIYEDGFPQNSNLPITTFANGDMFKIAIESGVVKYYKNSVLIYTSSRPVAPNVPLYPSASLHTPESTVPNAQVYGYLPVRKQKFGYVEANALELNMQGIYDMINNLQSSLRYCGVAVCGDQGGLY